MVIVIVVIVRKMLSFVKFLNRVDISVEIVFFVLFDLVIRIKRNLCGGLNLVGVEDLLNFIVVFGVVSGEGCFIYGGCVFCLYMKVSLLFLLEKMF